MDAYTTIGWINDNPPAINQDNLNHMDNGIAAVTKATGKKYSLSKDIFEDDEMKFSNVVVGTGDTIRIRRIINIGSNVSGKTVRIKGKLQPTTATVYAILSNSSSQTTKGTNLFNDTLEGEFDISHVVTAGSYLQFVVDVNFPPNYSQNVIEIDNLEIYLDGSLAPIILDTNSSANVTFDYKFLMSGNPAVAKKSDLDALSDATLPNLYIESNGEHNIGSNFANKKKYGGAAHYGFRYPIQKISNIKKIKAQFRIYSANGYTVQKVYCKLYDSSLNLLGSAESYAQSEYDLDMIFEFSSAISIPTSYGFIEFWSPNAKTYYEDYRQQNQNTDIMPIVTNGNRGYYCSDGSTWARVTVAQTKQFTIFYDVITSGLQDVPVSSEIVSIEESTALRNRINVLNATMLVDALHGIATSKGNNLANKNNVYDVYIYPGTYELYGVLDLSDIEDQTPYKRGLEVPDYVNLIGVGNVEIKLTLPDDIANTNLVRYLSVLNTYGENHFKNLTITAQNCRYCVHDDDGGAQNDREISFENCRLIHKGNTIALDIWPASKHIPYGAGYTGGRVGRFKNCIFDARQNTADAFFVHNSAALYMISPCWVYIDNCVFKTVLNTNGIEFQHVREEDNISEISVNNSQVKNILLSGIGPSRLFGGGNNSDLTVTNTSSSENYMN